MLMSSPLARLLMAVILTSAAALPVVAEPLRPLRVGYIVNGPERTVFEEQFEMGLRDKGYIPGRNLMTAFVPARVDAILVSTRNAARMLGVEVPISVLSRADEVIE